MGPIEAFWITLILMFGAIGAVRGFLRELGVTASQLVAMYMIAEFFEKRRFIDLGLQLTNQAVNRQLTSGTVSEFVRLIIYSTLMIFVVFISYHGETLDFPGTPPRGPQGFLLNILAGLVNGYLFVGTIWYYLHQFNYPLPSSDGYSLYEGPLTSVGEALVKFLPQQLFPGWAFLVFLFVLIIARVIR